MRQQAAGGGAAREAPEWAGIEPERDQGGSAQLLETAIERGCTAFVTGELKHHDVLSARSRGCDVVLAGHTNTERGWLKACRKMLRRELPEVEILLSRADRDPLRNA